MCVCHSSVEDGDDGPGRGEARGPERLVTTRAGVSDRGADSTHPSSHGVTRPSLRRGRTRAPRPAPGPSRVPSRSPSRGPCSTDIRGPRPTTMTGLPSVCVTYVYGVWALGFRPLGGAGSSEDRRGVPEDSFDYGTGRRSCRGQDQEGPGVCGGALGSRGVRGRTTRVVVIPGCRLLLLRTSVA